MSENKDKVITLPVSAQLSQAIVTPDGAINARAMVRTLGTLVSEVLSGEIQTSRASTAIRGMRTLVALADSCRRSGDSPQPLLRVQSQPAVINGTVVAPESTSEPS